MMMIIIIRERERNESRVLCINSNKWPGLMLKLIIIWSIYYYYKLRTYNMSKNIYKMYSAHCVTDAHNFNVTDHEKSKICMQIVERRSTANLSIHVRSCPEPFSLNALEQELLWCVLCARNCMQNEFYHYLLSCGNAVFVQSAHCVCVHCSCLLCCAVRVHC